MSIALGASPTQSAFIYFLAADVILVGSFCLYMVLSSTVSRFFYLNLLILKLAIHTVLLSLTISSQGFLSILFEF